MHVLTALPYMMEMIAMSFSLLTAYQILTFDFIFSRGLDKYDFVSYNTTPAEEGWGSSLLLAAWLLPDHMFIISRCEVDHIIAIDIQRLMWYTIGGSIRRTDFGRCIKAFALMSCEASFLFSSALFTPKTRPHINHSILGFDHIFDHNQNRSTRRQECTRV